MLLCKVIIICTYINILIRLHIKIPIIMSTNTFLPSSFKSTKLEMGLIFSTNTDDRFIFLIVMTTFSYRKFTTLFKPRTSFLIK